MPEKVPLAFDFYPGNPEVTLVALHGLFGSARNLAGLVQELSREAQVFAYDARNHGRSGHAQTHTLHDLVSDLDIFLREHGIIRPVLLGHSMGGLTAMAYAGKNPDAVRALIILDIAPRSYPPGHAAEIAAQKLDVKALPSRKEIDAQMAEWVPDATVRQFLQMNLGRDAEGRFYWVNNIQAIEASPERTQFPEFTGVLFPGPVLAIRGLASNFVSDADVALLRRAFPQLTLHEIAGAEHWLHYSHREEVAQQIRKFLSNLYKK